MSKSNTQAVDTRLVSTYVVLRGHYYVRDTIRYRRIRAPYLIVVSEQRTLSCICENHYLERLQTIPTIAPA